MTQRLIVAGLCGLSRLHEGAALDRRDAQLLDAVRIAVAHHSQLERRVWLVLLERTEQVLVGRHRCAVDGHDHVAQHDAAEAPLERREPELRRGAARHHLGDDGSRKLAAEALAELGARHVIEERDTKRRPCILAVSEDLAYDARDGVDGDGEADTHVGTDAAGRIDHRVDSDQPAGGVEERPARVARVDGGVGLDAVLDRPATRAMDGAPEGGDDALRQRVV
mmetsp:Transcript_21570/g.44074  ORF Transcript_21570/g.44074 Transcript_21570/m.44074 type:complete len:223 (+) Transcript_21570:106-774(+)